MGDVSDRAIERVVMGMNHGGKIPMPIIEAAVSDALDSFYEDTEIAIIELTAIDEVADEDSYSLPTISAASCGRVCRIFELYKVARDGVGAEISRTLVSPSSYRIGLTTDGTATLASITQELVLATESATSATGSLIALVVAAFTIDDFIPPVHLADAKVAVASKAMQVLAQDTGKPWSSLQKAQIEESRYQSAVARVRFKSARGNAGGGLKMNCTSSFV